MAHRLKKQGIKSVNYSRHSFLKIKDRLVPIHSFGIIKFATIIKFEYLNNTI
ncbi:MAG: hypothetical protein ACI85Q_001990 [Salibacteraceae bacterium]|jgi:hypothetical protein